MEDVSMQTYYEDDSENLKLDENLIKELFFYRFYEFTMSTLVDKVFNMTVDAWTESVESFSKLVDPTISPDRIEEFKKQLVNSIFQRGKMDYIFNKWSIYVNGKLELPRHVTLPEDEVLLAAQKKDDMISTLSEIEANKERIWILKKQLANIDDEMDNLRMMNIQLDEVLKIKKESKSD